MMYIEIVCFPDERFVFCVIGILRYVRRGVQAQTDLAYTKDVNNTRRLVHKNIINII